jgi:proteasome lid subunit RPN8/RPN11
VRPWLAAGLTVTRAALDAVEAHARRCYPAECCGLLAGPAGELGRVDAALPFDNLADRYHEGDPGAFPRTSREAYVMNGARVLDAMARAEAAGRPVKALYHSHCDRGAYFSAEDERRAREEGALLREVAWLVTSARGGGVDDHRLFVYDPVGDVFAAVALVLG